MKLNDDYGKCEQYGTNHVTRRVYRKESYSTKSPQQQTCGCSWFKAFMEADGLCDRCRYLEEKS